jgi:hypothetical protein
VNGSVILVEGESDKAALSEAATVLGIEVLSTSIQVMHGATNLRKSLAETVSVGVRIAGLYDAGEEALVVRALTEAGMTDGRDRLSLERVGFYACDRDLEEELIRALGTVGVTNVIASQGNDYRRFQSLQQMPEWRGRPVEEQLRRWFGSGGRRKVRYAKLLAAAMKPSEVPRPMREVLRKALDQD